MASRAIGLTIKIENTDQDTPNQTHVLASCREIKNAKDLITPSPIANQTRLCSEADGIFGYFGEVFGGEGKAVAAKRCDGDGDEGDDSDSDSEEEYESDGESDSDSDSDDEE
ncbi:hypothetical protein N7476_002515 [Penicillium atrosanguineum]|uniref:Uncharacterized protein n=1 Tax=Penicillium atrosanguineum TaxID=1132637 RepID=A0A9W9U7Q3_9EURO|nr:hypothetical protein N7476_002515 [Penicillium atrosanguineum]